MLTLLSVRRAETLIDTFVIRSKAKETKENVVKFRDYSPYKRKPMIT